MSEDEVFALVLEMQLNADIDEYSRLPDHKFSMRFERKMKKLLAASKDNSFEWHGRHIPLRKAFVIALASVILTAILTGASLLIYKLWDKYRIQDLEIYSLLGITDIDNAPTTLEDRYELGIDLSGYTKKVHIDEYFEYFVQYRNQNEGKTITFDQITIDCYQNVFLNTEDAIIQPKKIDINGRNGIFFETKYENMVYIVEIDNYIFEIIGTGFSENELLKIVKTVKKVK